ncbi:MAG: aspartoacylase [Elainellaceae cyanobacterium]
MNQVSRVAIVGGTHGNELTGVYVVKKFEQFPQLVERSSFETLLLVANPKSFEIGRRYVETDLNRCFALEELENPQFVQYEQLLAKVIDQQLRNAQVDFLIEIHSSTANMGLTLLLSSEHVFNLRLAAYLSHVNPLIRVLKTGSTRKGNRLRDRFELGLTIEVGPIAQGVLNATLFYNTENLIFNILDYLEHSNQQQAVKIPDQLTVFSAQTAIDFPRNEQGDLAGMIHPDLEGQDYQPIELGHPLFLQFDGSIETYQGPELIYPVFINESAYLEKGIAFYLATKQEILVPSYPAKQE